MSTTTTPPVSSTVMEQLRRTLPKHGFTGNSSRISHSQVEFIGKLVDDSKVAEQIDAWRAEDRVKTAPGGRQSVASTRTVLILFLLLSTEHSALFVKEMATIASDRLSGKSLRHLDLWGTMDTVKGWYFPLWRALHRALDPIDPKPGKQWKFSTPEQYEETLRRRVEANSEVKQARLDWVCNALIEATLELVPEAARSQWQGDLCVDATVVPAYRKRGRQPPETTEVPRRHASARDRRRTLRPQSTETPAPENAQEPQGQARRRLGRLPDVVSQNLGSVRVHRHFHSQDTALQHARKHHIESAGALFVPGTTLRSKTASP